MENINKAIELDKKLPEKARNANSHLNELKEEFSTFFHEESGNSTVEESLDEIKEYINSEQKSLKSELNKLNTNMKILTLHSTELNQEYNTKKREGSESTDSQPSSKKRSRNDDGDDNGRSGPSGGSGGFPSAPSSSSSPPSSSSSAPSQEGSSSDTSSRKSAEANSSDLNLIYWLDILLKFLKALFGDDDYMD